MAPTVSRPVEQTEEAMRIFFIMDGYLQSTSTHKPSRDLERFPPSFERTPWRRLYMALGEYSAGYLTMEPWDPSELSAGSARGKMWFFTELPRIGEKICRKTVAGHQTWSGRSGRGYKNGFPTEIRVAKLVIKGTVYHMLELTLDKQKPVVALCKIWRSGTAAAESPQTMSQGTSTSNQVEDNLEPEEGTMMQVDQSQGQFECTEQQLKANHEMLTGDYTMGPKSTEEYFKFNLIEQHEGTEQELHIPHYVWSTSNYSCHPDSICGQFEGIEQEPHMPDKAMLASDSMMLPPNSMWGQLEGVEEEIKMHEDVLSGYVVLPKFTEAFIPSTSEDDASVYQCAVSYLNETKDPFKYIVLHGGGNEAHEIASKARSLASAVRNLLSRFPLLGINTEPANTKPTSNTADNNQLRTTTNSVTEQVTMPQAPERMARDEIPEQVRPQQHMEGYSISEDYFYVDDFISLERGDEADYDDQGQIVTKWHQNSRYTH